MTGSGRNGVFNSYIRYIRNKQCELIFKIINSLFYLSFFFLVIGSADCWGIKKKIARNEAYLEFASKLYEAGIIPNANGIPLQPHHDLQRDHDHNVVQKFLIGVKCKKSNFK